ncbi:MAG: glucuronate isomerase [Caldilineaceae bacterium]|nr:glucuronate isomerase [Caldilineaceae bacterium]
MSISVRPTKGNAVTHTTSHAPNRQDRYFSAEPGQRAVARQLFQQVGSLPLICPHGHVDPHLFADPEYRFSSPTEMFLIPDHYIFRMLYSQGISMESVAISPRDGGPVETDHRKAWQIFAENFHLFRATPTGIWLVDELHDLFGITEKLNGKSSQAIYDAIDAALRTPEFSPRRMFERFNVEALTTTDPATSTLADHKAIRESDWSARILPTFRPDAVVNLDMDGWRQEIERLSEVSGVDVRDYSSYIQALEQRRAFFKEMGATATDHAALTAHTEILNSREAEAIFQRALAGKADGEDARRFTGHMLVEMARMSSEDGLVMQLHIGSYRNHNPAIYERFGRDMGADIPIAAEFTRNLKPLLDRFGNAANLTLILFNLDETTYGRELAPLAGHYPALRLGPPWWYFDSINGIRHFFDAVVETAGIYNTVGFNDDTRAFPSIPTRHELWRRVACDWVAGLVVQGIVDEEDASEMAHDLAYGLAKKAYRL